MFCKPVSTLAVAALLLAGAAEAQGGARSDSTLRIGSTSSTREGYGAYVTVKLPSFLEATDQTASAETFADPGYEASADATGDSLATATNGEDSYASGRFFGSAVAFTGSDGSTLADTLLFADLVAAQLDEGSAAAGVSGSVVADATPTTDDPEDFDGASAESSIPVVSVSEATPFSTATGLRFTSAVPFVSTRADAPNAEALAELSLFELACAGLPRGECR
mmetsp:Transcript_10345/g.21170  ORF Transcript_10345/g.21170 Transcript_10345/m.21170 type:complete len:222 (-) Transcript_10345:1327-1992(-)